MSEISVFLVIKFIQESMCEIRNLLYVNKIVINAIENCIPVYDVVLYMHSIKRN